MATINFYMDQAREIRIEREDGFPGKLIGRYLPGLSYRITDLNKSYVEKWIEEGICHIGVLPGSAASLGINVAGSVKSKSKK